MAKIPKLAPGATGEMVMALQHALMANGFSPGSFDGKFGSQTLSALQTFQDSNALPVKAECDKACWAALMPG
jgi:peptidoglycan hydrolase-like protein with peptidoglycan-binding domain